MLPLGLRLSRIFSSRQWRRGSEIIHSRPGRRALSFLIEDTEAEISGGFRQYYLAEIVVVLRLDEEDRRTPR
jgi:hypothetical protein